MNRIVAKAKQKLRSQEGASLMVALLFFVMCAAVGSVILAAASSSSGRISNLETSSENQRELYLYTGYLEKTFTEDNRYESTLSQSDESVPVYVSASGPEIKDILKVMASRMYQNQFSEIKALGESSYWGKVNGYTNVWQDHGPFSDSNLEQTYQISGPVNSEGLKHNALMKITMKPDYSATVVLLLLDDSGNASDETITFTISAEVPEIRYDTVSGGTSESQNNQVYFRVAWTEAALAEA